VGRTSLQRFLKPSLLREGAERSEAEGFFLSVSDAAIQKPRVFLFAAAKPLGRTPPGPDKKTSGPTSP